MNQSGSSNSTCSHSIADGSEKHAAQSARRLSLASHASARAQFPYGARAMPVKGRENEDPNREGLEELREKKLVQKVFTEQELKHFLVLLLEWCLQITKSAEGLRNVRSFSLCELVSLHFGNGEIFIEVLKAGRLNSC